jgi:uncharacterized protein
MKKLTLFIIILSLVSCKTVKLSEKDFMKISKYNFEEYNKAVQESTLPNDEKNYMTTVLTNLVKTDKEEIFNNQLLLIKRKFFLLNDTIKLEYFEFEPKYFVKTGIFFLGSGSSVTDNFSELQKISLDTKSKLYVLNYRGYGKSDGTSSLTTLFMDNQAFLTHIEKNNTKINFAIGHSFGTISATYLAVDNKIENLLLLAPFSDTKDFLIVTKKLYTKGIKSLMRPFLKLTADDYSLSISNVEKIKLYNGRLVIFHPADDKILPFKMGVKVFKSCNSTKKEFIKIQKGGHFAPFESANWNEIMKKLQ